MKVLYATQATGNGHLSRAKEIIPYLQKHVDVDIMLSGYCSELVLPFPVTHKKRGLSFYHNKQGGIHVGKSLRNTKARQLLQDIRRFPVENYDVVINDFEPISAWAARLRDVPCLALSHQSCFYSDHMPRPARVNQMAEKFIKYFAPVDDFIGFHFQRYDSRIETPIIRKDLREGKPENKGHVIVYLPGYDEAVLEQFFQHFPQREFKVYTRRKTIRKHKNIRFIPIGSPSWKADFLHCDTAIMGAGFEGPSEAIFLRKKLLVIPLRKQYEQSCNAAALHQMGISVIPQLHHKFIRTMENTFSSEPLTIPYEDHVSAVVERILEISEAKIMQKRVEKADQLRPSDNQLAWN